MIRSRTLRLAAAAVLCGSLAAPRAFAESKDMIQLQTQIQQLQDAVARLQQSNDERMGVLKDLVQQTADSVNRMSIVVNGLGLRVQNQQDALTAKSDQVSGQIQSLNDSLDELKARMPYADLTEFAANPDVERIGDLYTVDMLVQYVSSKLAA